MSFKVVYTSTAPIAIDRDAITSLGAVYVEKPAPTEDDVLSVASDADVVVARGEPITRRVLSGLKSCRLVFTPKVGYENIDVVAATEMGVCVANMPGLSSDEVSDHALTLLLCLARRIMPLDRMVRGARWRAFHGLEMQAAWRGMSQLRGQTVGIVGFGSIGKTLATKAKAFGFRVIAYDPYLDPGIMKSMGVISVDLPQLIEESDYISLHSPLTTATRHMLSLPQFRAMKPTAYVINTSRGGLIDEEALYIALTRGHIAGAGLDVLETEPVSMENPLLGLANVLFTGHSAHYSDQVWADQASRPAKEIARIMSGAWPEGWVNPQVEPKYISRWRRLTF